MAYTTIDKPSDYFNTKLYTGNGSSQTITGVGFQPDWLWIKSRGSTGNGRVHDVVRGVDKQLYTSLTNAEYTYSPNTGVTSFDSDGFSLGSDIGQNTNTETYVAWNWLAGGSSSSNSDGDITSTVSANTTSGFSVVSYTGNGSTNQTIGHGLGAIPDFIIVKQRNTTRNWPTYTKALGNGVAFLDITDAWAGGSSYQNYWYVSGMTSSTFGISNNDNTNASSGTFIAYCFSAKQGYSKFGSYTGNGNADGTFVYTGFRPAFVMMKNTQTARDWFIWDNERTDGNPNLLNKYLRANTNEVEGSNSTTGMDFLSNGFKCRNDFGAVNHAETYLYMAFAKSPFVTAGTKAAGTAV